MEMPILCFAMISFAWSIIIASAMSIGYINLLNYGILSLLPPMLWMAVEDHYTRMDIIQR